MQLDDVLRVGLTAQKRQQFDLAYGCDWKALLFVFHADALEGKVLRWITLGACEKDLVGRSLASRVNGIQSRTVP